jgi:hypothetical protein
MMKFRRILSVKEHAVLSQTFAVVRDKENHRTSISQQFNNVTDKRVSGDYCIIIGVPHLVGSAR